MKLDEKVRVPLIILTQFYLCFFLQWVQIAPFAEKLGATTRKTLVGQDEIDKKSHKVGKTAEQEPQQVEYKNSHFPEVPENDLNAGRIFYLSSLNCYILCTPFHRKRGAPTLYNYLYHP
jgi:hypothetical protein